MDARTEMIVNRAVRCAPRTVLHVGIGELDLAGMLAARCAEHYLVDPVIPRACQALAARPDLRRRSQVRCMPLADVLVPGLDVRYDLVFFDLAAPALATVDVPVAVSQALRLLSPAGEVFVANLRDPRLERVRTPASAGWSPPAVRHAITRHAPAAGIQVYPPLGGTMFDLAVQPVSKQIRAPLLRWGRDLWTVAHLAQLLAVRRVVTVRIVGIPALGLVNAAGVDARAIEAVATEHGYRTILSASMTRTEYQFDVLVERVPTPAIPSRGSDRDDTGDASTWPQRSLAIQ